MGKGWLRRGGQDQHAIIAQCGVQRGPRAFQHFTLRRHPGTGPQDEMQFFGKVRTVRTIERPHIAQQPLSGAGQPGAADRGRIIGQGQGFSRQSGLGECRFVG